MKLLSLIVGFLCIFGFSLSMAQSEASSCAENEKDLSMLQSLDGKNGKLYSFAICYDKKRKEIRIKAYPVTGTVIKPANFKRIAKKKVADKDYALWGDPYKPTGEDDKRMVEYRIFLNKDDKPVGIEIFVQTVNADGSPKEPKSVKVEIDGLL